MIVYILIIKISDMPVRANMFLSRVRNLGNNLEIDYFVQLGLHESDNKPAEGALYLLRISLENSLPIFRFLKIQFSVHPQVME